jgi:tellurite resistance protein
MSTAGCYRPTMLRRIFGTAPQQQQAAAIAQTSLDAASTAAGDTATVRRIVSRLERLPVEQARLVASAAYTLARAAQADLEISPEETAAIEMELQAHESLDEATAVLVTEMAKLQARTVGGTEDFIVTREFAALANDDQKVDVLRACFAISAASGSISAEETAVLNQIANELSVEPEVLNSIRNEFRDRMSSVQAVRRIAEGR